LPVENGPASGRPLHQFAVETSNGIDRIAVAQDGKCSTIPFATDRIKQFEARSPIGKKRKSPKY